MNPQNGVNFFVLQSHNVHHECPFTQFKVQTLNTNTKSAEMLRSIENTSILVRKGTALKAQDCTVRTNNATQELT
jgi:hypothetical protein